jgi:hypothetical protein
MRILEAGGLVSYGPNIPDLFRRAAEFVIIFAKLIWVAVSG